MVIPWNKMNIYKITLVVSFIIYTVSGHLLQYSDSFLSIQEYLTLEFLLTFFIVCSISLSEYFTMDNLR